MQKFYYKTGNDTFAPMIKVTNILLDDTLPVTDIQRNTISGSNGIIVNVNVSSKQNKMDSLISDVDYLKYTKINLIVFQDKDDIEFFRSSIVSKTFLTKALDEIISDISSSVVIQFKTINLTDIVDLSQLSQRDYSYKVNFSTAFTGLDKTKDIILCVVPIIDFRTYLSENKIEDADAATDISTDTVATSILRQIYSVEYHTYNILINKKTINDNIGNAVLNDVREAKKLNTNILQLLAGTKLSSGIEKDRVSYITDIFTSFDYGQKTINNFFFFDKTQFVLNSAFSKNIPSSYDYPCNLYFEIFKDDNLLSSFTLQQDGTITQLSTATIIELIPITTTSVAGKKCIMFNDTFPKVEKQNFKYSVKVSNNADLALLKYYNKVPLNPTGMFFDVLIGLNIFQNFINDPRNTNSTTGMFERRLFSRPPNVKSLINDFIELINLFSNKQIVDADAKKIINSLDFKKTTFAVCNDFIFYANNTMNQIGQFFDSIGSTQSSYTKTSNLIMFQNKMSYHTLDKATTIKPYPTIEKEKLDDFPKSKDNFSFKYFVDVNKEYDVDSLKIDEKSEVSYKIINSVIASTQITYSSVYSLLDSIYDELGVVINTVEKTEKDLKIKTNQAYTKSSTVITRFQKPADSVTDAKKEISLSSLQVDSTKIVEIAAKANTSISKNSESTFKFELYYLNKINKEFLIPQARIEIYNTLTNKFNDVKTLAEATGTYFARTTCIEDKSNVYFTNKSLPTISNTYFVLRFKPAGFDTPIYTKKSSPESTTNTVITPSVQSQPTNPLAVTTERYTLQTTLAEETSSAMSAVEFVMQNLSAQTDTTITGNTQSQPTNPLATTTTTKTAPTVSKILPTTTASRPATVPEIQSSLSSTTAAVQLGNRSIEEDLSEEL